jgi:hypothetical protein
MIKNEGFQCARPFFHYEDEDVRQNRCQIHLGIGGRQVLYHDSEDDWEHERLFLPRILNPNLRSISIRKAEEQK